MKKILIVVGGVAASMVGWADATAVRAWTADDTELFWSATAAKATRITTAPRLEGADAEAGEGMLEAFGKKCLPRAYARYQEKHEKAKEREAVLKENFPGGRESDSTGGRLYDKVAKSLVKAVAEVDRCHDELCHYYLLHKAGVLTEADLAPVDSSKISIVLAEVKTPDIPDVAPEPTEAERIFAGKYLPAVLAGYDRLSNAFSDGKDAYVALAAEAEKIDAVYGSLALKPFAVRLAEIRPWLGKLSDTMKQQKILYAVEETTEGQLAELDRNLGAEVQSFESRLPVRDYVRLWFEVNWTEWEWQALVPLSVSSLAHSMVAIPGQGYAICKYEVTQVLWEEVMGSNPSNAKGPNFPVENVTWNDCHDFIAKLNALPEVKESGWTYRLPTEKEWEYACRAGAAGDCCKLADGTEITKDTLGEVAWYDGNSEGKTHSVGEKSPNAFGLYDMHGNVWEWCEDLYQAGYSHRVNRGGSWYCDVWFCRATHRGSNYPDYRSDNLGFRLAASRNVNR